MKNTKTAEKTQKTSGIVNIIRKIGKSLNEAEKYNAEQSWVIR